MSVCVLLLLLGAVLLVLGMLLSLLFYRFGLT
jgi:hypothetical protein